ncbi:MAG TPA: hypothetical protein VFQ63_01325, partial [Patescibacteria group bacterium]|nr:hypothetical protein [Patescibacteria group bacterium]
MAHEITTNQEQLATKRKAAIHAMDLLPSVVPSALESERLIGIITEQTITSLKNRYLDIARTSETQQGSDIVTRTITQLGGRQKLIEESLSGKTASIDTPAKPDMFRTTLWDLLVSEEFGRIDREALSQRRDQDGKTIHENHIHAASEAIAKARIIQERADSFSQADIAQQLLAAQKHGSKVTEAELRLNRARKELGGIDPEKHPQEHERLTQTARAIEKRLLAGEKEGFSDTEQRIIAKELGGINAITRGIAQEALTQEV